MVKTFTKILCLLLALTMAFTMVACNTTEEKKPKPASSETVSTGEPTTESEGNANIDSSFVIDDIGGGDLIDPGFIDNGVSDVIIDDGFLNNESYGDYVDDGYYDDGYYDDGYYDDGYYDNGYYDDSNTIVPDSGLSGGETITDPEIIPDDGLSNGDEFLDIGNNDDYEFVILPETAYETQSPEYEFVLDDDFGDLGDIEEDFGPDRETAVSLIQKDGEAVEGKEREFNIDTTNVAYADFRGLGSNVFPSNLTEEAYLDAHSSGWDYDNVNFEVDADRWNTIKPHWNRMWFDIHWFATNEESNPKREDIENNVDYQNYLNGVYDYESDYMLSMYKYLQVWQDAGTHTALNYSWKVGERIQEWFNFPNLANPNISAPYDLDAYAESCVDLLQYLRDDRGFTLVDCVTFYNEPHYDGDFAAFVDEKAYWVAMVKRVNEELVERGIKDDIEVWANEHGSIQNNPHDYAEYVRDHGSEYVDMWAFHVYYSGNTSQKENNYSYWYHFWSYMRETFGKRIYVTETYASSHSYGDAFEEQHAWRSWNDSWCSQTICTANVGLYGVLSWGMTGGYVPEPVGFTPGDGFTAAWEIPDKDVTLDSIQHTFFEQTLITNYIPAHSDVLMVDWTGDDIRGSAFALPDGGYTILIDAKGNTDITRDSEYAVEETSERNITFNLKGLDEDVTFYRYGYDPDEQVLNPHGTVNSPDYTVNTKNGVFKDTVDKDYGMYLYTTLKPIKQIEIDGDSILHKVAKNAGTYDFDAKCIDCEDDIVWSISAATDGERNDNWDNCGSIDQNGTYTIDENAEVFDKIAIRASLKSDPSIYDTVVIRIVDNQ